MGAQIPSLGGLSLHSPHSAADIYPPNHSGRDSFTDSTGDGFNYGSHWTLYASLTVSNEEEAIKS